MLGIFVTAMKPDISFQEKPTLCPFCNAPIVSETTSESGQSFFVYYECGLGLANQSGVLPRLWRFLHRHDDCENVYQRVLELSGISVMQ